MPKLTLSADKAVIERAKQLADERGTSVSAMFSQFVESLSSESAPSGEDSTAQPIGPLTRKALGLIKLPKGKSDRELTEEALMERYGR